MTPQRLVSISILVFLALLAIGVGFYFIIVAHKGKKKTPPQLTAPTLSLDTLNNTYAMFPVSPPVYFSRVANTVVPTSRCCGFQLTIEKRQTDNGSLYDLRQIETMDFLTILYVDVGLSSWYSIVLCPTIPTQGWTIQEQENNQYTFSQQIDNKIIFLGLSVDKRTIVGLPKGDPSSGISISLVKK